MNINLLKSYFKTPPIFSEAAVPTLLETLSENVILNWDMQDTGDTLTDSSGNDLDGTVTGATNTTIAGRNFKRFDGNNDDIAVTLPNVGTSWILGGVFVPAQAGSGLRRFFGNGSGGTSRELGLDVVFTGSGTAIYAYNAYMGVGGWIDTGYDITPESTIMIFLDTNGTNTRLFINGVKQDTFIYNYMTLNGATRFCNDNAEQTNFMDADVGWITVLNTTLTDEQHATLYNEEKAKYGL